MNWSEEKYRKIYIRKTATRLIWPWQARAALGEFLCVADEVGLLDVGTKDPIGTLAVLAMLPKEVVQPAVDAMLDTGFLERVPRGFLITKFVEAQEATKTPAAKKRDQRDRDRAKSRETTEPPVTGSHRESPDVPLQPSLAQPPAQPSPAQPPAQPKKRGSNAQAEIPDVVPPKAPREFTVVQRLQAFFAEERDAKLIAPVGELKGLGLKEVIPDDPPNWSRLTATVTAWLALWPDETPEYQESFARMLIGTYFDDPHWATATRWDRKGNDTGELQPYPLRVLLSEKVWRPLFEKLERELDGTPVPGGVH